MLGDFGGDDNPTGGGGTTKPENKSKSILARQVYNFIHLFFFIHLYSWSR